MTIAIGCVKRGLATVAILVATPPASADDRTTLDFDDREPPPNIGRALLESVTVFGVQFAWYTSHPADSEVDFDFHWKAEDWEKRLSPGGIRFDTNSFYVNAERHAVQALVQYRIARSNHFGILGSELFATAYGVVWEYIAEFREYPSLNDLIIGATTGLEIGEPTWQIAQLWRSPDASVADRVKTTIFSPIDGLHDLIGNHHVPRRRHPAWRSIAGELGAALRDDQGSTRWQATASLDVDLVNDRNYVRDGKRSGSIVPGTWSRVRGRATAGYIGDDADIPNVELDTRTALAGHYTQEADGRGVFFGLGTAFTYRRDRLAEHSDHFAAAHVVGPQLQVLYRARDYAVRWDLDAYGDFSMVDALVFMEHSPFVTPPPYVSALQAQGYYYGLGYTATSRLRLDTVRWSLDAELASSRVWQLPGPDRVQNLDNVQTAAATTHPPQLYNTHGVHDTRTYGRGEVTYHAGRTGLSGIVETEYRTGEWRQLSSSSWATTIGLVAHVEL